MMQNFVLAGKAKTVFKIIEIKAKREKELEESLQRYKDKEKQPEEK